ncbi:MAG: hypothetical protein R2749_13355 [Acidimicrobiales bacterium]
MRDRAAAAGRAQPPELQVLLQQLVITEDREYVAQEHRPATGALAGGRADLVRSWRCTWRRSAPS